MKKIISQTILFLFFASCSNPKTDQAEKSSMKIEGAIASTTFKVWGNCEMCKETIEGSLKSDGINSTDWNKDTKIISVSFDTTKISLDNIQKNVAAVGYDNEKYKGNDIAYGNLPECCQYDRK